jgi:UDP-GlcNAc:undecaprenyl-phosphate/decaprenyl-phosphate GlcNAc-1-phosphate transferase
LPDDARLLGAVLVSLISVWVLTPLALRVARRTAFYDHPVGYKAHPAPTAYLGGAAVIAGFLAAALAFGQGFSRFGPIAACAVGLGILGTLDDRFTVRPRYRIFGEVASAGVLWHFGLGWSFLGSEFEELVLTSLWIVAFTNAFNLMDNLDGAASTVGAVCAAGIAAQAHVGGDAGLAAFALALSGACLGFLRYNLRPGAPARIFLGDGGSMPIGFIVAAAAMNIPVDEPLGWPVLLIGALLLGVPILDTLLVVVSRTRRRVSVVTAGRDHLTHRLHTKLASARAVAVALALAQGVTSVVAIAAAQVGRTTIIVASLSCLALGAGIVAVLETPAWVMGHRGPPGRLPHRGTSRRATRTAGGGARPTDGGR